MGKIAEQVQAHIPSSYDALVRSTKFGTPVLQRHIDAVKYRLFGLTITEGDEANMGQLALDFTGKVATLRIIPAAVDFWGRERQSATITGTNENIEYPDSREGLWKIHERLRLEVKQDVVELRTEIDIRTWRRLNGLIPEVSNGHVGFKTADPSGIAPLYATNAGNLPWSSWS